jgi:hypothetical protein
MKILNILILILLSGTLYGQDSSKLSQKRINDISNKLNLSKDQATQIVLEQELHQKKMLSLFKDTTLSSAHRGQQLQRLTDEYNKNINAMLTKEQQQKIYAEAKERNSAKLEAYKREMRSRNTDSVHVQKMNKDSVNRSVNHLPH